MVGTSWSSWPGVSFIATGRTKKDPSISIRLRGVPRPGILLLSWRLPPPPQTCPFLFRSIPGPLIRQANEDDMKRLLLLCGALCACATKRTNEPSLMPRQVDGAVSEGVFFRRGFHSCELKSSCHHLRSRRANRVGLLHSRRAEWESLH